MACRLKKFGINYEIYDLDSPVWTTKGTLFCLQLTQEYPAKKSSKQTQAVRVLCSHFRFLSVLYAQMCVKLTPPSLSRQGVPHWVFYPPPSRAWSGLQFVVHMFPACQQKFPSFRFLFWGWWFGGFSSSRSVFSWTCVFRLSFRFAPNGSLTLQFSFHFLDTKNLSRAKGVGSLRIDMRNVGNFGLWGSQGKF